MKLDAYDSWLAADGPVAIAISEDLEPAQRAEGVFFPPTYAPLVKGEASAYVIDDIGGKKVALVDSVGSQANRVEPLFKRNPYAKLVPQAEVMINDRTVSLLDAGHRAADAVVRFSDKQDELTNAFKSIVEKGNAVPLAKLAPTSLVFGVWDSRGTGAKLPRLVGTTIRAYDIQKLKRSAQYNSLLKKEETEQFGQSQDTLSELGLSDAPSPQTHGGIIAKERITREGLLNLVALRALAGDTEEQSLQLRRYILGLALVAITAPSSSFLREGCLLVTASGTKATIKIVRRNGVRENAGITAETALQFAEQTAKKFGVGQNWKARFSGEKVRQSAEESNKKRIAKNAKKEMK